MDRMMDLDLKENDSFHFFLKKNPIQAFGTELTKLEEREWDNSTCFILTVFTWRVVISGDQCPLRMQPFLAVGNPDLFRCHYPLIRQDIGYKTENGCSIKLKWILYPCIPSVCPPDLLQKVGRLFRASGSLDICLGIEDKGKVQLYK